MMPSIKVVITPQKDDNEISRFITDYDVQIGWKIIHDGITFIVDDIVANIDTYELTIYLKNEPN